MSKSHFYNCRTVWTGNKGQDTASYTSYARAFNQIIEGKAILPGSADPAFLGDPTRHNPEDLLLAALSSCHLLWYLHLCSSHKILVRQYEDDAQAKMVMNPDGSGQFEQVVLKPKVTILGTGLRDLAEKLHHDAHEKCFIARSVNFPVRHEPVVQCI